MSAAMNEPTPVLQPDAVYFAENGRAVCARVDCAGYTALYSGRTRDEGPIFRASVADVREWAALGFGSLSCEGGHVTLTPTAGPSGWPVHRN